MNGIEQSLELFLQLLCIFEISFQKSHMTHSMDEIHYYYVDPGLDPGFKPDIKVLNRQNQSMVLK